ncbi:MAG: DNA-directed RNA polymerase subunit alpha [Bacteroidales bacterium]|jgi:DNA-directed RNA polymerase subunit alpha|nr:DNA-directed RNA polymerase subunit alpha [Bacteroidales bacterium]
MAILAFQKPDKVVMVESSETLGIFEFSPLEPGFGTTIGNSLRRVLLSSLEGFAITSVKISSVDHEFSSIKGVIEDVTDIVLNLKRIRFRQQVAGEDNEVVKIVIGDQEVFKAGDINKFLNNFQVLNPELEICHMESNVKLNIELIINKGRGYVPAEENSQPNHEHGIIAIDSIHTPIKNVKYIVDHHRVEQKTDYEKLILEVETDGSINPKDALNEAAKILIHHLLLFSDEKISVEVERKSVTEEFDENTLHMRQLLKTKLTDLDLSVRALNCLKTAEVETLGELVQFNKADLLKFRNFGRKSLTELEELVKSKQLEFGMNISKYKLDKD